MIKKAFLIGVGGAGVSSLAKYLYENNYKIYGSDLSKNENVVDLIENYDLVFFGEQKKENIINDFDFIIYSPAVPEENSERQQAKEFNVQEFSYPEFLGKISEEKFTISIAGTNGKTTTTTMVAEVLEFFKKDPTVVVGGVARKFNSNFLTGKSDLFVVESCEYKNSFLNLKPNIIAITNITPDHLDYFKTFENYQKTFLDFLDRYKDDEEEKILICNINDKNLIKIIEKAEKENIKVIDYKKYEIEKVSIPGEYNRENAQVVLTIADILNINLIDAKKYLRDDFVGSGRRFEYIGKTEKGMVVYDDYAHNPEALEVLLSGIKEKFIDKKNILIFQPHLFSRTEEFFNGFVEAISNYDYIYLLPIYKARENIDDFKISSRELFEKIKEKNKNTYFCENFNLCVKEIKEKEYDENFVAITVGAGDVYEISKKLI